MSSGNEKQSERQDHLPDSPLSPMAQGAIGVFEMFRSYVEAGFTERQALQLIAEIFVASQQPPTQP